MTPLPRTTRRIAIGIAAAAVMLVEISFTRLSSAALFYHYAFLAVSTAMAGIAGGALIAAARRVDDGDALRARLFGVAMLGALGVLAWMLLITRYTTTDDALADPIAFALGAVLPMTALGELVARLLVDTGRERPLLYGIDLVCSALGALLAIPLLGVLEGPGVLVAPALLLALLALLLAPARPVPRAVAAIAVLACGAGVALDAARPGPLIRFPFGPMSDGRKLVWERWNHHSQVRVFRFVDGGEELIIDRTAGSRIQRVDAPDEVERTPVRSFVGGGSRLAYRLGERPLERVGIIGVGGGPDILEALQAGAAHVDGFELNGRIIQLLDGDGGHTRLGRHPRVRLVHDEARHALERESERYDVLRMSLTDTWAATVQGGFVLSEASLYTVEAWVGFLDRLTPTGRLVVTRWFLSRAPSEAERTVALAAAALRASSREPAAHLLVLEQQTAGIQERGLGLVTVLVSASPWREAEVAEAERACAAESCRVVLAPFRRPAGAPEADWAAHFTEQGHAARRSASRYDVSVPHDGRPFFFLQVRPWDIPLLLGGGAESMVDHIVRSGVRGLVLGGALSLALALVLGLATMRFVPGAADPATRRHAWTMSALGVGYMLLQLGLHQRLSIVLGHPTMTLALVTAASILGTGIGSALFGRDSVTRGTRTLLLLAALALALALQLGAGALVALPAVGLRASVGLALLLVGIGLGAQLPALLRAADEHGGNAMALWAVNAAASVAGSALAAPLALLGGTATVTLAGAACYALVATRR